MFRVQWCPRDRGEQDEGGQDLPEMRYSMGYGGGEGPLSYIALGEDVGFGEVCSGRGWATGGLGKLLGCILCDYPRNIVY